MTGGVLEAHLASLEDRGYARRSVAKRRATVQAFAGSLNGRDLVDATRDDVTAYLIGLGPEVSSEGRRARKAHLTAFYAWCVERAVITGDPTAAPPTPSDEAVARHLTWMRLRNLSAASITQRRRALRRLAAALRVPLLEADAEALAAWQESLRGSPAYLANSLANVACFYRWLHESGQAPSNPAAVLVRPKVPRGVPRPMAEDRLARAIESAPPDIRLWLVLGAYAGLRVGEMSRLDRQDVLETAEQPSLYLRGKGGRFRVVPASRRVIDELNAYGMPSRGAVFRRRDGHTGPPSPARISQLMNEYLREAGIVDTAHASRHRYASRAYQVSKDLRLVQGLLGHADVSTTAGYCAYADEVAAAVVEQLDHDPMSRTLRSVG